ncbi:hypothetical protein BaRGS_00001777 [Batillaria attramentaria]|uniref:Uncharacterized protein n=1 Tax=Batillaria attramentaria TaxID=370345 RepID=A0ABD0M6D4_9CAEN
MNTAFSLKTFRRAFVQILTRKIERVIPGSSTHGTSLSVGSRAAVYHSPRRRASSAPRISLASNLPHTRSTVEPFQCPSDDKSVHACPRVRTSKVSR